jgi:hypothetical protein
MWLKRDRVVRIRCILLNRAIFSDPKQSKQDQIYLLTLLIFFLLFLVLYKLIDIKIWNVIL